MAAHLGSHQCDQIGRNFAVWVIFFGVGRIFFFKKYRPNDMAAICFIFNRSKLPY
jgi:hypothetical protein